MSRRGAGSEAETGAGRESFPALPVLVLLFGAAAPLLLGDGRGDLGLAAWAVLTAVAAAALAWRQRRRRSARQADRESLERLHQAQKLEAVGRLAGGLAHDVNNYLAVVRSHCEAVLARELPRERVEEKMRTVVGAVVRASSLLERLLAFGRRQPGRAQPVDWNPVVEAQRQVMGSGGGVEVTTRLAPDLWPVEIDLSQAEQVLANLWVNARDATAPEGRIEVATRNLPAAEGAPDRVVLEVADTGAGIPKELRERIFEPFFTTREGRGASGLGLSTVYGIVRAAGGQVEVESEPGRGSTFRVVLPRTQRAPAPAADQRDLLEGTERLLLVDDNRELAAAVAAYLEDLGYRVTSAAAAGEALAAAAAARREGEPFELVITDVQLGAGRPGWAGWVGESGEPGGSDGSGVAALSGPATGKAARDEPGREEPVQEEPVRHPAVRDASAAPPDPRTGPELVARLRSSGEPVRALYMTGYTERIVLRAVERGDEAYFVKKPFSMEGLARLVRSLLDADLHVERP